MCSLLRTSRLMLLTLKLLKPIFFKKKAMYSSEKKDKSTFNHNLPYPSCTEHIKVIRAQCHGLILTIYGSRMTKDGILTHYQKKKYCQYPFFSSLKYVTDLILSVNSDVLTSDDWEREYHLTF